MIIEGNRIVADEGKGLVRVGSAEQKSKVVSATLSPRDKPDNWAEVEYGEPDDDEPTEADKDAALRRFGVEV